MTPADGEGISHVGQIDQIDHNLDRLDPNLPLGCVLQGLYSADPRSFR